MVLTMCTFYMGETLSVAAEDSNIVPITSYSQLRTEMANAANKGKTLQFQNDLYATEWTFDPVNKTDMTVTGYKGDATVKISVALDETFGTVLEGSVTKADSTAYAGTLYNGVNIDGNGHAIKGFFVYGNHGNNGIYLITQIGTESTVKDVVFEDSAIITTGTGAYAMTLASDVYGKVIDCENAEDVTIAIKSTRASEINVAGLIRNLAPTGTETNPTTLKQQYEGLTGGFKLLTEGLADGLVNRATIIAWQAADKNTLVGGIATRANGGIVRNSANYGDVYARAGGIIYGAGGIMGLADPGRGSNPTGYERNVTIYNCANYGNIDAKNTANAAGYTAGILGYLDTYWSTGGQVNIALCYNSGTISTDTDTVNYGIITRFNGPNGSKWLDGTKVEDGGYSYKSRLNGGTALNFSKSSKDPNRPNYSTDRDVKVGYVGGMASASGSISMSRIYSAPNNTYSQGLFDGLTDVTAILTRGAKYLEAAKPWKVGESGDPEIDFASEHKDLVISTVAELNELRSATIAFQNLGNKLAIKATLGADIDFNPGYTFGYDAEKQAATVTNGDTTLYVGYGANSLTAGKFYTYDGTTFTETEAPALTQWRMFDSLNVSGNYATDKIALYLDGAGHTINLYLNGSGFLGLVSGGSNYHISNLTIDGLILNNAGSGGTAAFAGYLYTDSSIVNCVNNATVLQKADTAGTSTAGFVGTLGVNRGYSWLFERLPHRVSYVTGCTNNGTIAAYTDAKTNSKLGGVVGHMFNGEVSYCTNTGDVTCLGSCWMIAGVVGHVEAGTNWGKSGYSAYTGLGVSNTGDNVASPLQTTVRVIGNSSSGTLTRTGASGTCGGVLTHNTCWVGDGAWGISNKTYSTQDSVVVMPSEVLIQYNTSTLTGGATAVSQRHDSYGYSGLQWKDAEGNVTLDLSTASRIQAANIHNPAVSSLNSKNTALAEIYPVAELFDRGYMIWMDYDYSSGGVPHAIKIPSAEIYNGLTLASSTGEAVAEIGISNAEALRFIRDSANYVTSQTVVIADTEITDIVAAHDLAVSMDIAADGTVSATDIAVGTSVSNAVNYYLAKSSNDSDLGLTKFTGVRIKLLADIDLGGEKWVPITDDIAFNGTANGGAFTPKYRFEGIFEGNNKTISNFTNSRERGYGFIGTIGGTARNLNFSNVKITGIKYLSILTGYSLGTIKNVKFDETCSVTGADNVGAAVPWQQGGVVNDCVNYATINATGGVAGGLIGSANGSFANNKNYATITSTGGSNVGGIVGTSTSTGTGEIGRNVNYGKINAANANNVAGIMGRYQDHNVNTLYVKDSANYGEVIGKDYVGGIIGNTEINFTAHPKIPEMSGLVNEGKVTGNQYVGGIAGRLYQAIGEGFVNKAEVNGVKYVGGVVGQTYLATLTNSENTALVKNVYAVPEDFGDALGNLEYATGGIVGLASANSTVVQNINRGEVNSENWKHAAGIVGNAQGDDTLVEGNVNYGTIKSKSNAAGIVSVLSGASSADKNALVKGNVNFGEVQNGGSGNLAGIVAWKTRGASEVAYNVNFGAHKGGGLGSGIIGTLNCNTAKLGTDVYGNVDATGWGITVNSEGWFTNNYVVGATNKCTLIDGKAVTLDRFKFGEVADIINNLSYEADNFLATYGDTVVPNDPDKYLYGANGNERPASVTFWAASMKTLTADKFVAPVGLEADYMVQEIGVDEYPLPKLAAEIIKGVAAEELTVPAGPATVAPEAPETEGTEQFIGYIDYDRNIYKAGAEVDGKYLYPVSVDFYTAYGAGVRTTSPTGIRYQTLVKDNLDMLPENFVENFGTIILPYNYVEQMMAEANAATFNKKVDVAQIIESGVKHIDIVNNGWADPTVTGVEVAEGYKTYMGSLVNILDNNLNRDFTGISYLKVEYADDTVGYITADWQTAADGTEFVDGASYSKDANARSIVTIAERALADVEAGYSDIIKAALQEYIDRAEELGLLA